jgi:O-antigen ligase
MSGPIPDRAGDGLRVLLLALLTAAPLAFGSVHEPAFIPLLVLSGAGGLFSWARGHWARSLGADVPPVPARRLILALHLLVLVQLVPLPPLLLRMVSPGSYSFYNDTLLMPPLTAWRPVSVSPADTWRGLAFLAAFSLFFGAVFREFGEERWRRRLAEVVVATGVLMTVVALLQAAAGTTAIYGLWKPTHDYAVFGPYVNQNHFAGYLVMAIPLALAFTVEAFQTLGRAWRRRRVGWLALGGPEGSAAIRRATVAMLLVVGLLASQSRGGVVAFAVSAAALPLAFRHRRQAVIVIAAIAILGLAWIGLGGVIEGFERRGLEASRLVLWKDMARMIPRFPVLGVGFNAFGTAYLHYQTIWRMLFIGEAHNDYLQVLLDLGLVGSALVAGLLVILFRAAARAASRTPLDAGILGALLALGFHALVDFNWQIPANALTYVALSALAMRRTTRASPSP